MYQLPPRVIAFYLPQFHPIPENDKWWRKGFTEWTNVGKAKSLFWGHYQPRVPADLGYYDLRVPETREAQAELARKAGIEGFCYYHYWFGNGKQLLERPFNEVLQSGKPDFPFCLGWANETWKGFSHGLKNRETLIRQEYPGIHDFIDHFYSVLPSFQDPRYILIEGKPLFLIYKPLDHPSIPEFINTWRNLAIKNGLNDIYFIGQCTHINTIKEVERTGVDAVNFVSIDEYRKYRTIFERIIIKMYRVLLRRPYITSFKRASKYFFKKIDFQSNFIPTIVSGWDHTPRSGIDGLVLKDFTPGCFRNHINDVFKYIFNKHGLIFLKSWNEWGEGNYMEPDLKYGCRFIDVLSEALNNYNL
jgi:hypothetical protein